MTRIEWLAIAIMALAVLVPSMIEWVKKERR